MTTLHKNSSRLALATLLIAAPPIFAPLEAQTANFGERPWSKPQVIEASSFLANIRTGQYPTPGLSTDVSERFRKVASVYLVPKDFPRVAVMAYDHFTRCALLGEAIVGSSAGVAMQWVRFDKTDNPKPVLGVALDGVRALHDLATDAAPAPGSGTGCASAISELYKTDPRAARGAGKLAEHARAILRDGKIGSEDAPLTTAAFKESVLAVVGAQGYLGGEEHLATIETPETISVVLGPPGGDTRFVTDYRKLGSGRWRFESAYLLGNGLLEVMKGSNK